jgi:hypothetical protein
MASERENREIKDRAAERLLALPGVVAVGLGSKEVGDEPTGELAIKVFVKVKHPPDALPADQLIPAEIEGIPTDVIESGEIHPVADPPGAIITSEDTDPRRYRPLAGGGRIRREGSGYEGTMGCFLVEPGDIAKVYGLTNFHVVDVPDAAPLAAGASKVGQPSGKSSVTDCCADLIGTFVGGAQTDERDEALVRLGPGIQWKAEIADIGIVSGKHQLTQAEAMPQTYKVRKRGARTLLTGGVVRALEATTSEADNLVIVKPNPNSAAGTRTVFFAFEGDSGSALVNEASEVVGLVWARDDDGNGYAYAIHNVLSHFANIEHAPVDVAVAVMPGVVNTVPGAPMVATPPELRAALGEDAEPAPPFQAAPPPPPPGWVPEPLPLSAAPGSLEHDLDRSALGRLLMTVWMDHQAELLALVNSNRRVATVWHRSGASGLFQALARMPLEPELALPSTIHGRPLHECLDRMQATFERFGSAPLRRDLARVRAMLPDLGGLTYPQIVDSLGAR